MTQENQPAFPHGPLGMSFTGEDGYTSHQHPGHPGMELRDYFAAKALQGELHCQLNEDVSRNLYDKEEDADNRQRLAEWCYLMADAMLEARKQ